MYYIPGARKKKTLSKILRKSRFVDIQLREAPYSRLLIGGKNNI